MAFLAPAHSDRLLEGAQSTPRASLTFRRTERVGETAAGRKPSALVQPGEAIPADHQPQAGHPGSPRLSCPSCLNVTLCGSIIILPSWPLRQTLPTCWCPKWAGEAASCCDQRHTEAGGRAGTKAWVLVLCLELFLKRKVRNMTGLLGVFSPEPLSPAQSPSRGRGA